MNYLDQLREEHPELNDVSDLVLIKNLPRFNPSFSGKSLDEMAAIATQDNNAIADTGRLLWSGVKSAAADVVTGVEQGFDADWQVDDSLRKSADDTYQNVDVGYRTDIEKAGFREGSENTAAGLLGAAAKS